MLFKFESFNYTIRDFFFQICKRKLIIKRLLQDFFLFTVYCFAIYSSIQSKGLNCTIPLANTHTKGLRILLNWYKSIKIEAIKESQRYQENICTDN